MSDAAAFAGTAGELVDRSGASIANLKKRGELLRALRQFFYDRGFVEVETPLLGGEIIPELFIEPRRVAMQRGENLSSLEAPLALRCNAATGRRGYLQASPELQMKRLVAAGMGAIFQVTRSFRAEEHGRHHRAEFTIVEWYRVGDDLLAGMQLLDDLCRATLGTAEARRTTYAEAFATYVGVCPHRASAKELGACAASLELAIPATLRLDDRDEWLNLLLALRVEPHLGRDAPEILYDYPASQAALARVALRENGTEVAERFELYWQGVELANGYHELTDATELRRRLEVVNLGRQADGKEALPLPESLLAAMEAGLPRCAGCALGFDRLAMLAIGAESIGEVMAFSEE